MDRVSKYLREEVTKRDKKIIAAQIKRAPRDLIKIAKRCSYGQPQVIMTSPLLSDSQGIFFPTLFWLTCPYLDKEIARLEEQGWINKLQDKLARDKGFSIKMEKAHQRYRDLRQRLIKKQPQYLSKETIETGVGGIADLSKVKCLHAHYAHY